MVLQGVKVKVGVMVLIVMLISLWGSVQASATANLNGIGAPQQAQEVQQTQQATTTSGATPGGTSAQAVGQLFEEVGVNAEASEKASNIMRPVAYWANVIFSILLSFVFIALLVITGLDFLYIAVPISRRYLAPQDAQGGGMGGFGGGMGGFGGGMGGMGMGGGQQSSSGSVLGQLISDEAKAAVAESQPQGGGGGMMGGMGMGGFGGGMGMGGGEPPKMKNVLMSYAKKRIIFFIMLGICSILLSTTLFTEIGVDIGTWVMNRLVGIQNSIPE